MQICQESRMSFVTSSIFFQNNTRGTSRLEGYSGSFKNGTGTVRLQCQLPTAARTKVAQATDMAAFLGIRPLSFMIDII